MFLHQVSDLYHLGEVVCDILLVVNAEEAVGNIVVYFLFVLLQRLQYLHVLLHSVWRLLVLAQLGSKGVEGALELRYLRKAEEIGVKLLVRFVYLLLDVHHLLVLGSAGLGLHEIKIFIVILEYLEVLLSDLTSTLFHVK